MLLSGLETGTGVVPECWTIGLNPSLPHYTFPVLVQWGAHWGGHVLKLLGPDIARLVLQYADVIAALLPFGCIQSQTPESWRDASLSFDADYRVQELRVQSRLNSRGAQRWRTST
jgi:hypothetical protein